MQEVSLHGGRLRETGMPEESSYPTKTVTYHKSRFEILPRQAIKHQGSGMTHNEVRQRGYWITGGTSVVANLVLQDVVEFGDN